MSARLSLIAAVAANGVIGDGAGIPWRLSTDLRRFRSLTMGKPVVMGRKTFDTLKRPLPGRTNIVVSRRAREAPEGVRLHGSLDAALDEAGDVAGPDGEIMVMGGGEIYASLLSRADRLYITHVDAAPDGDRRFPEIDPSVWRVVTEEAVPAGPRDDHASRFVVYERRRGGDAG